MESELHDDDRALRREESLQMLRHVIDGDTYEAVASLFGVSRTAVERRVKSIAHRLTQDVGVEGLRKEGTAFVRRLRTHRDAILAALEHFDPDVAQAERHARVLGDDEVRQGGLRIKARAARTWHDLALYHILFATGLRPLEVARLRLGDYLRADGSVRRESRLSEDAAINGRARPLYFTCHALDEALAEYLTQRLRSGHGLGTPGSFGGLDPHSRLFLGPTGEPYPITANGAPQQRRQVCRALLDVYRRLFRIADIEGLCTQSARLTLMSHLYARGADEEQVGTILGIADRSAVRGQLPRPRPTLADLFGDPS